DTGEWSLGKALLENETVTQAHVIDNGVGVLNADLTLTDWPASGVYTAWFRMGAGGDYSGGEMVSFTFSITGDGVEISPGLSMNDSKSAVLSGLGFSGALPDKELRFYLA